VVDEAHHAVAPTYRRIFDHLGLFAADTKRLLELLHRRRVPTLDGLTRGQASWLIMQSTRR
jgi:superfamily II DNA or RNA helicase